jgi:TolB-like protein
MADEPRAFNPTIGTVLGRYRIMSVLGKGGMGSVWRAEDQVLPRLVALKLIAENQLDAPGARDRFLREGRNAAKLDHPGLVTVYDAGEIDGHAYIAYKLIEGETLETRASRSPLPMSELWRLIKGTASAMAHAHAHGVVHRDLTANNVMIRPDGEPVIVDFGLALASSDTRVTFTGTAVGTVGYIAPEQWAGEAGGEASDRWSLGVVWYRAAVGKLPFGASPAEAVMQRVLNSEPDKPRLLRPEIPQELERVILRLLEKDARSRYANTSELALAIGATVALGDAETQPIAVPEGPFSALTRWWRRLIRRKFGPAQVVISIMLTAALGIGAMLLWPRLAHSHRIIAVLPFRNTSEDPEGTAYIEEGLGEELVSRLGVANAVRVLPWTTTGSISADSPLPVLAGRLAADLLVVGSFRADGERIHVHVELVDRHGLAVWAGAIDEEQIDVAQLQTRVATQLLSTLRLGDRAADVRRIEASAPGNPEAYAYYLRGASYLQSPDSTTKALAKPFFEKALELDPKLAEAYVGIGAVQVDGFFRGAEGARALESARESFERALELRPGLPHAVRGLIEVLYEQGEAERALKLAKANAPTRDDDLDGMMTTAWAYTLNGLPEKAVPILNRVLMVDPTGREAHWLRTIALCWEGNFEAGLESGQTYVREFGDEPEMYTWMGMAAHILGRTRDAAAYYDRALAVFGDEDSNMYVAAYAANFFARSGDTVRVAAITRHWIPLLRARRVAAPDNGRIISVLIELEIIAGDQEAARHDLADLEAKLRASPVFGAGNTELIIASMVRYFPADRERARSLLAEVRTRDLAYSQVMLLPGFRAAVLESPDRPNDLESIPEFQAYLQATRARLDYLRARY